jgi:adenylosuccinate synthase
VLHEFPADLTQLAGCAPIYEEMPGWTTPTRGVQQFDKLPAEARAYIARLEDVAGVPAAIVSTGSDREETILRKDLLD